MQFFFFWKIFSFHSQTENSKTEQNGNLKEHKEIVTFKFYFIEKLHRIGFMHFVLIVKLYFHWDYREFLRCHCHLKTKWHFHPHNHKQGGCGWGWCERNESESRDISECWNKSFILMNTNRNCTRYLNIERYAVMYSTREWNRKSK